MEIIEALTDNGYKKTFTLNEEKGIIPVEMKNGFFSLEDRVLRVFLSSISHILKALIIDASF